MNRIKVNSHHVSLETLVRIAEVHGFAENTIK